MQDKLYFESLETDNTKCPNCGGTTQFNPKLQKVQCLYCKSLIDIQDKSIISETVLDKLLTEAKPWSNTEVIKCNNCGAKEIISKGEIATECSFCGTTNVVKTDEIVGMKPQGVCPFEKSIDEAKQFAQKWSKNKFFAPNKFKKEAVAKNIHGIYSPVFTFDCHTKSTYWGRLAKNTTYYTYSNGKRHAHTRTTYFSINGSSVNNFDDYLIQASSNIPQNTLKKLEPFPTEKAVKYNKKYLSGYKANTYSKNGYEYWNDCKNKFYGIIKQSVLRRYHYSYVVNYNQNTQYFDAKFKYMLLPIYVGHYIYKQKTYNFFVNGITGKVTGNAPVSGWKIALLVLAIILPILITFIVIFSTSLSGPLIAFFEEFLFTY